MRTIRLLSSLTLILVFILSVFYFRTASLAGNRAEGQHYYLTEMPLRPHESRVTIVSFDHSAVNDVYRQKSEQLEGYARRSGYGPVRALRHPIVRGFADQMLWLQHVLVDEITNNGASDGKDQRAEWLV